MGYRGELCQWEDRCDPVIPFPRHEVLPPVSIASRIGEGGPLSPPRQQAS